MLHFIQLFAGTALAQTPTPSGAPAAPTPPDTFTPGALVFLVIMAVFYMLLIRPQQKKLDEQTKMIKALTRGDRVITAGGVHGKIVKIEGDDALIIEIADGVQVKVVRNTVSALAAKTEPAKTDESNSENEKKD